MRTPREILEGMAEKAERGMEGPFCSRGAYRDSLLDLLIKKAEGK
jgi:hypothetical protein